MGFVAVVAAVEGGADGAGLGGAGAGVNCSRTSIVKQSGRIMLVYVEFHGFGCVRTIKIIKILVCVDGFNGLR